MLNSPWSEISVAKSANRHELILSGPGISERIQDSGIDNNLFSLLNLNFLNITDTCLNVLPDDIGNLVNLTSLVLYSNKLTCLPQAIGKLVKLKLLDVSRNNLTFVPPGIRNLTELSSLNLSSNNLKRIPCLERNAKLLTLNLSANELENFPDICYSDLEHLSEVKLNSNKIKTIPVNVNVLSALKLLDLSDNTICVVPAELADAPKLKELYLKGNKLNDRRLGKLVEQCHPKKVIDYLRQNGPSSEETSVSKGKKGKRKKGNHSESSQNTDEVEDLCQKIQVVHLSDSTPSVIITEEVKAVRPHIVCCIVQNLDFTTETFKKFIQMQTKLHDSICEKRNVATIATHDLKSLPPGNLTYTAEKPESLIIKPLMRTKEFTGAQLFSQLQKEADDMRKEKKRNVYSGIHRFLYLLEGKPVYPCLLDSTQRVISFPPITNSDVTKMSCDSREMLVEVTSSESQATCRKVLDTFLREALTLGIGFSSSSHRLVVKQVKTVDVEGNLKTVYPSRNDLVFEDSSHIVVVRM